MDEQKDWLGLGWHNPVAIDPRTGMVALAAYEDDIRQSIIIILMTERGERVMRPDFGCGIHGLVYAVIDTATLTRVEAEVRESLIKYEARIEVIGVKALPLRAAEGILDVELEYRVRRTNQTDNLVYPFYYREGGSRQAEVRRQ